MGCPPAPGGAAYSAAHARGRRVKAACHEPLTARKRSGAARERYPTGSVAKPPGAGAAYTPGPPAPFPRRPLDYLVLHRDKLAPLTRPHGLCLTKATIRAR